MEDERFMRMALREAERGHGWTSPNPAVGAVIVREGRVLARGFHHHAGAPHAEIEAIRALKKEGQAKGATIYVTLEPCSTHGRTPPCTEAIRLAGLARVVIGATDPNPRHAGRAVPILRASGIAVHTGILAEECTRLNRAFNRWIVTGKPWVIAKAALTVDGRLARHPGESRRLSSAASHAHAHRQRARVDAILIGAGTLRADNPHLTVRDASATATSRQPWRVVLSRNGEIPAAAHLFTDKWKDRTLVYRRRSLRQVLTDLGRRKVTSVMIEGGGQILGQALAQGLVDEIQLYFSPWLAGGPVAIGAVPSTALPDGATLCEIQYEQIGPDVFLSGEITL